MLCTQSMYAGAGHGARASLVDWQVHVAACLGSGSMLCTLSVHALGTELVILVVICSSYVATRLGSVSMLFTPPVSSSARHGARASLGDWQVQSCYHISEVCLDAVN